MYLPTDVELETMTKIPKINLFSALRTLGLKGEDFISSNLVLRCLTSSVRFRPDGEQKHLCENNLASV